VLIAALSILARGGHAFTAHIIGDGELYGTLRDRTQMEGISERVAFCRMLPHEEMLREHGTADIFVLSSEWEGCPNVVLEAMAHGVPVVATAVGGVPELVENGISGILVPPRSPRALADALARLTNDQQLRTVMGNGALRRAACFAPAVRFERLYRLITAG
jgi:glycosyltransferase involved in cell wall biosynthesis